MREIGSEFWDVPVKESVSTFLPSKTQYFLSGRCALQFIIDDIMQTQKVVSAALPSWCCESMIIPFLEAGLEVKFYTVWFSGNELIQNLDEAENCDVILVMDYFGCKSELRANGFKGIVIRDLTHSVFLNRYTDADYYFGSLRKWAGFYTGGFAYKKKEPFIRNCPTETNELFVELRKQGMHQKKKYIEGSSGCKNYLSKFAEAEELLEQKFMGFAAAEDIINAAHLDVDFIKKQRLSNASYLLEQLSDISIFSKLAKDDCPLFVPILVPDGRRDDLRKYLIENEIYCPIHWPISKYHSVNNAARQIYDNEISLVCDQRYNAEDMYRIVETVKNFWRE